MEKEKLKRIFKLLLLALIILLVFSLYILPKSREGELIEKDEPGVSTDVVFQASQYDNGKMVQDYLNPTEEEKNKINRLYGAGNTYFSEDGLHIIMPYDQEGERLVTDRWPENEITKKVLRPEMELLEVEVSKKSLKIKVYNVTERELKKYVKNIKENYTEEIKGTAEDIIYTAYNSNYESVIVKFDEENSQGSIIYEF